MNFTAPLTQYEVTYDPNYTLTNVRIVVAVFINTLSDQLTMNKKVLVMSLGIMFAAAFGVLAINGATSAIAQEEMMGDNMMSENMMSENMMEEAMMSTSYITKSAVITDSSELEKVRIYAGLEVPTDGSGGAFGYGVISGAGLEAIIVTTTHAGVYDSIAQEDADDASFHNHYVTLHELDDDAKCPGLEVKDISFQEPGDVDVSGKIVVIEDTPYYFAGTHSLSQENISFNSDMEVDSIVYFTIDPVNADGETSLTDIAAVCINDVTPTSEPIMIIPAYYWEGH